MTRGVTAFPLRDKAGNPAGRFAKPKLSQRTGLIAGDSELECNVYGSGPGLTDNQDGPGWRFYATKNKSGGYSCKKTPDEYTAPTKESLNKHSSGAGFANDVLALRQAGLISAGTTDRQDRAYALRSAAGRQAAANGQGAQFFGPGRTRQGPSAADYALGNV